LKRAPSTVTGARTSVARRHRSWATFDRIPYMYVHTLMVSAEGLTFTPSSGRRRLSPATVRATATRARRVGSAASQKGA
jgi:hypothetical protein